MRFRGLFEEEMISDRCKYEIPPRAPRVLEDDKGGAAGVGVLLGVVRPVCVPTRDVGRGAIRDAEQVHLAKQITSSSYISRSAKLARITADPLLIAGGELSFTMGAGSSARLLFAHIKIPIRIVKRRTYHLPSLGDWIEWS